MPKVDFDLIERAQDETGFSPYQFSNGDLFVDKWIDVLGHPGLLDLDYGRTIVRDWLSAKGRDSYAVIAEALLHHRLAWRARGSGYADTVSPESLKIFQEELDKAKIALQSTSPRIRKSAPWHATNVLLAFANPKLRSERLEAFQSAVDSWPLSLKMYERPMRYAQPKWGGSYELMDSIARYAVEKTKSERGNAFYAILYQRMFSSEYMKLKETAADWSLIKFGIKDVQERGGGKGWLWRDFAMMACQVRDRPETKRLFKLYDDIQREQSVVQGEPGCRRFASDAD